jgi:ribosomal protein S18 acetylase RimI-like enzyme
MASFQAVDQNLREAMRCYSHVCDDGEVRQYPGVAIASSGINFSVFNSVMFTSRVEDVADLDHRVNMAEVHFTARSLGRSYWVCEDLLTTKVRRAARKYFESRGMHVVAEPPGMYCDRPNPLSRRLPAMDYRLVNSQRTRFDFVELACSVFALPYHVADKIYGPESTWSSPMIGYVGYVGERPVSIVSTVLGGDAVGVYSLGTAPQYQGHGYGESIMRYALEQARAKTGLERTVLQTTRSGRRLYERMGYKAVTKFTVYTREICGSL